MLLRAGICRDARTKVDRTPLHMAAYEGHLQIVDALIKHGAEIDCRDLVSSDHNYPPLECQPHFLWSLFLKFL